MNPVDQHPGHATGRSAEPLRINTDDTHLVIPSNRTIVNPMAPPMKPPMIAIATQTPSEPLHVADEVPILTTSSNDTTSTNLLKFTGRLKTRDIKVLVDSGAKGSFV